MDQLKFNFPKRYFSENPDSPIEARIEWFESLGFYYYPDWIEEGFRLPERIRIPSGEILDVDEIYEGLANLRIGDSRQIELLQALEYEALFNHDEHDRLGALEGRSSIEWDEDERELIRKYSPDPVS